jgi:hypothetical protein
MGSSTVDYTICSSSLLPDIPYFQVHPFHGSISDHCLISFMIRANISRPFKSDISLKPMPMQFKWSEDGKHNFIKALQLPNIRENINEMKNDIQNCIDNEGINVITNKVTKILVEAAQLSLRRKGVKKKGKYRKPWSTIKLRRLEREVKLKGDNMIKIQTGESRRSFFIALKKLRKERKYSKRHYLKDQMEKLHSLKHSDPRKFWNLLQELKNGESHNQADKIEPGIWYGYLTKANKSKIVDNDQSVPKGSSSFTNIDFPINESELKKAMNKLRNNKSPGLDQILNEMLK